MNDLLQTSSPRLVSWRVVNGVFTGKAICRQFEFNAYFQSCEESAGACMPVAGIWLTNGKEKKEAITHINDHGSFL